MVNRQSPVVNLQSPIINSQRQSSLFKRQSSLINRQSLVVDRRAPRVRPQSCVARRRSHRHHHRYCHCNKHHQSQPTFHDNHHHCANVHNPCNCPVRRMLPNRTGRSPVAQLAPPPPPPPHPPTHPPRASPGTHGRRKGSPLEQRALTATSPGSRRDNSSTSNRTRGDTF